MTMAPDADGSGDGPEEAHAPIPFHRQGYPLLLFKVTMTNLQGATEGSYKLQLLLDTGDLELFAESEPSALTLGSPLTWEIRRRCSCYYPIWDEVLFRVVEVDGNPAEAKAIQFDSQPEIGRFPVSLRRFNVLPDEFPCELRHGDEKVADIMFSATVDRDYANGFQFKISSNLSEWQVELRYQGRDKTMLSYHRSEPLTESFYIIEVLQSTLRHYSDPRKGVKGGDVQLVVFGPQQKQVASKTGRLGELLARPGPVQILTGRKGEATLELTGQNFITVWDCLLEDPPLVFDLLVAIDFSGWDSQAHLHRHQGQRPFVYCIERVLDEIGKADTDQIFYVFGTGANIRSQNRAGSCVELTDSGGNSPVYGAAKIIEAYELALGRLGTDLLPMIRPLFHLLLAKVRDLVRLNTWKFSLLLIVTANDLPNPGTSAGEEDLLKFRKEMIEISRLPLSVLVVGLKTRGNSFPQFEAFARLDKVEADGQVSERQAITFVPLMIGDGNTTFEHALFERVPGQVGAWATAHRPKGTATAP
jgi:hypothetical protein